MEFFRPNKSQAEQDKDKKNLLKIAGAIVAVAAAVTLGVKAYKSNQVGSLSVMCSFPMIFSRPEMPLLSFHWQGSPWCH